MEENYSIEEILLAVKELHNEKKMNLKNDTIQKDYSIIPTNTLKLIDEAEKVKK